MTQYIRITFLALATLVLGTSCEDRLNLTPPNALETTEALQLPTDYTNAIRGVYTEVRQGTFWGGWNIIMEDLLADNLIICSEGRFSKQTLYFWTFSGNTTWDGLWRDGYETVYAANLIIENIDNLEDGEFKDNILGEALALRAFAHMEIARIFIKFPQFAAGEDLGIPYVTSSDVSLLPDRPSVQGTWDAILADLNEAEALIGTDNGIGRLNKAAVNALIARHHLYTGNFDAVIAAATAAIDAGDNPTVGTRDEFGDIYIDATENGVVWKIRIVDEDGISPGVQYSQTGATGTRPEYVVDFGLYQLFQDNDIRKSVYIETSDFAGKTFNNIAKYFGRPGGDADVVDTKPIRWAEVYLTRAEAYAETGQDGLALADLDAVRSERYENFTSPGETGQALKDAIALERRLELAFEGFRLSDLKRKNLPVNRSTFGDEFDGGGQAPPDNALNLEVGDIRFQMPIPQNELNNNPNMSQNPGY